MTNAEFDLKSTSKKIINIGTAGGYSKPSTGYTFMRIQVLCAQVVAQLAAQKPIKITPTNALFMAYDSIFLDVFDKNRVAPKTVFTYLFKKNKAGLVLRFLDEKTTMAQNLKIMSSVPIVPFVKAAMRWIIQ
jgi:lycopene beta-cyclase